MALYTHWLVARKEAAMVGLTVDGFSDFEHGIVKLENVGDALFQALLLDNVKFEGDRIYADLYTIYH